MDKVQRIIEILNNKRDGTVHGAFMGEIADELAALRAENERLKRDLWTVLEHARIHLPHLKEGFSVYDIAKEALK